MPELYIITGSNGAGKSTIGPDYLPDDIQRKCIVFNGDKIFMDKQKELWKQGIRAIKEARNLAAVFLEDLFDKTVDAKLEEKEDFVYEGHFTNESTWDVPRRFKSAGYQIHLIFFGVSDTELSMARVIDRSKEGGHYVSPVEVNSNFYGNLEKLNEHFEMFDSVHIVDTSETEHHVLAIFEFGLCNVALAKELMPEWFVCYLPSLFERLPKK